MIRTLSHCSRQLHNHRLPVVGCRFMAGIFISFIHEEVDIADGVRNFLRKKLGQGTKVFLSSDKWTVLAGEDWLKRVKDELTSAKIVVLMLSEISVQRPWVNFEAGAGWLYNKVLIPVCFGGLHKGAMPKPYSAFHRQGV